MSAYEGLDEVTCQEVVELVTDYLEGVLPARTRNQVEEHLVMCHYCESYLDQMRATVAALRGLSREAAPGEPSELVLAALRRRKEESG